MGKHERLVKGQRFIECDKRFHRVVEVVKVVGGEVHIKTVASECMGIELRVGRITKARADRFYRYSNGYRRLYGKCHECQIEAGGVIPKHGHNGITVTMDTCSVCLKRNVGCVPTCDYDWPKEGRRALWD